MRGFGSIGIVIGVVLLLVVGGGVYYLGKNQNTPKYTVSETAPVLQTPTPITDASVSLKTYNNSKYGFSIQYPQDATTRDTFDPRDNKPSSYLVDFQLPRKTDLDAIAMLTIEALDNPQQLNAKDYFTKNNQASVDYAKNNNTPPPPSVENEAQVKIGDVDAYVVTLNFHNYAPQIATYIPKGDKMFHLYFYEQGKENDPLANQHTKIFNQIITTFRFTK